MDELKSPEDWLAYAAQHFPWLLDDEAGLHIQDWLANPGSDDSGCPLIDNPVLFTTEQ